VNVTLQVPPGADKELLREFKRLNPSIVFLQVLEPVSAEEKALAVVPKTEIHAKEAGVWLDLLPGLLAAGATILCPAAWLPFVTGAIRIGIPKLRALLAKEPARERWTLAEILALEAEVDALPDPQT
jgi:hypothetical protein